MNAVISLAHRRDRLARFEASYAASGWQDVLGAVEVIPAIDGRTVSRPEAWSQYPAGAYGCHLSHLSVIERALIQMDEQLFVFEDDAVFTPGSAGALRGFLLDVPSHDVLWLGGHHFDREPVVAGWRQVAMVMRTHAYSLSRRAMLALAPALRRAVGHLDATFMDLISEFYVPEPMLVGQAAGVSDISGYSESERWWNR